MRTAEQRQVMIRRWSEHVDDALRLEIYDELFHLAAEEFSLRCETRRDAHGMRTVVLSTSSAHDGHVATVEFGDGLFRVDARGFFTADADVWDDDPRDPASDSAEEIRRMVEIAATMLEGTWREELRRRTWRFWRWKRVALVTLSDGSVVGLTGPPV